MWQAIKYPQKACNRLFQLPEKGTLDPNGPGDPLEYYYRPLVGRLYRDRIEQSLSLLTPPYESILEIGYGSGILLPTLCSMGSNVYGVDTDSEPLRVLKSLRKVGCTAELVRGDIQQADFPEEHFDLIVSISVFEHIRDLSPVVSKIFRLLRPGGELLVGMPRVDTAMSAAFRMIGFDRIEEHHVTAYSNFLKIASEHFVLNKFRKIPSFTPRTLALYYIMLLRKPD